MHIFPALVRSVQSKRHCARPLRKSCSEANLKRIVPLPRRTPTWFTWLPAKRQKSPCSLVCTIASIHEYEQKICRGLSNGFNFRAVDAVAFGGPWVVTCRYLSAPFSISLRLKGLAPSVAVRREVVGETATKVRMHACRGQSHGHKIFQKSEGTPLLMPPCLHRTR